MPHSSVLPSVSLPTGITGTWRWDFEAGLFFADERVCRLFDLPSAWGRLGVSSERFLEQLHHQDRVSLTARLAAVRRRHDPFFEIYRVLGPAQSVVWVRSFGLPVREADGSCRSYVGLILSARTSLAVSEAAEDELVDTLMRAHDLAESLGIDIVSRLLQVVLLETGRQIATDMTKDAPPSD